MRRAAIAAAGLGAAGVGVLLGQWPTAQVYGPTICRGSTAGRRIALTYDDGPNPAFTPELMRILDRYDARATFFLIGEWAEREPGLIRELEAAGHAIGNHTYTHPTMPMLSSAGVTEEMARCRAAVEASGVQFSTVGHESLMRPPYGRRRPGTLRAVRAAGYVPVTWSVTCYDWRKSATTAKIARRAGRAIEGEIVLLHDGSNETPTADRAASVAATEEVLRRRTAEGYSFVTVPELVAEA